MKAHVAVTLPINPPSASFALSQEQVWKGLDIKARNPMGFVPISACEIVEDNGERGITRRVKFIEEGGPLRGHGTEVITYYPPMKADFHMLEKEFDVQNIISTGENDELLLTFTFVADVPNVEKNTPEGAAALESYRKMGKVGVQRTIEAIREYVVKGEI